MSADIWATVRERSAAAHASGALYRIESEPFFVEDGGIEFVVRRAVEWQRQLATQPRGRPGNPFLEPEPELVVIDELGAKHRAMLNKYHVVEDDVSGFELPAASSLVTLQGGEIAVSTDGGPVLLNDVSTVTLANVAAANGVAHVVDTVLLPPG